MKTDNEFESFELTSWTNVNSGDATTPLLTQPLRFNETSSPFNLNKDKGEASAQNFESHLEPELDEGTDIKGLLKTFPKVPSNQLLDEKFAFMQPNVSDQNGKSHTENLQLLFNQKVIKSCLVESRATGDRVEIGKVQIIHRNDVPEMVTNYNGSVRLPRGPGLDVVAVIGTFNETDLFYGAKGTWVVNVPAGKYAKAWKGMEPVVLNEGTHVIHEDSLRPITSNDLVDKSADYIQHGNIHVIRVWPGHMAKIRLNNKPYILESRDKPYVFISSEFRFTPNEDFFRATVEYIRVGSLHFLQIPQGKIAAVRFGTRPKFLEARDKPYIILNDRFSLLEKVNVQGEPVSRYHSADDPLIINDALKRVIVLTGYVAITYKNGILKVLKPNDSGEPYLIDDPYHKVDRLLELKMTTLRFPSESRRNELNYIVNIDKKGDRIGSKCLLAFKVSDADLAFRQWDKLSDLHEYLENLVIAEMNQISQKTGIENCSDELKANLAAEMKQFGIEIVRFCIEESKSLNPEVNQQNALAAVEQNKQVLKLNALDGELKIAEQTAKQAELKQRREAEIHAELLLKNAEAQSLASQKLAEGIKAMADAQAYAWDKFGELLDKHPSLQQLMVVQAIYGQGSKLHDVQQATLQSIARDIPIVSDTMTRLPMMGANPATFFNNALLPNAAQFLALKKLRDEPDASSARDEIRF